MEPLFSKVKNSTQASGFATVLGTAVVAGLGAFGVEVPVEAAVGIVGVVITVVNLVAGYRTHELVG